VPPAGRFIRQPGGYRVFIPGSLPPSGFVIDTPTVRLLSKTDRLLGRLDGACDTLPNPDLFVAMYVRQEAVLSSQIEGTQSTLQDVLEFETDRRGAERPKDVEEVVNYVSAMNYGLQKLEELPLSNRLIRDLHRILMSRVRGHQRDPGKFRRIQNWLGSDGCDIRKATYVPPPVSEMNTALSNLENYIQTDTELPELVRCALAHAQFETIHPFLDGNGRIGRLLITLMLCERQVLQRPLLYLSHYFKRNRLEYYDRLTSVRTKGDWVGWVKFFLKGVVEVAQEASSTARLILRMRESHRLLIGNTLGVHGLKLLDYLFEHPLTNVSTVSEYLKVSFSTANTLIAEFQKLAILHEYTGRKRNRRYRYVPYLDLFESRASPFES